ncbi:EFR1 family ferrodoxin [Clostridium sediminicola]|uniref:EFR1 family ferrodoxin n=1 Tax=Clostridium sediminicola TaxID=3114879 RepID=UPI0031F1EDEC
MKILILYFSGTGNTEFVSRYIKDHLNADEHDITLSPIEYFKKENISQYDTLFFGFPVYACGVPNFIKDYLKGITVTTTKTVFIFCTKAFFSGAAVEQAFKLFREQGYNRLSYADVTMPGSDGLAFSRKDSKIVDKIGKMDFSKLEEVDKMLDKNNINQKGINIKYAISNRFISKLLGVGFKVGEKIIAKKFWVNENCIRCGKCEKICPSKNIKVNDDGISFEDKCYLCMRCLHQCPKEAIQIGKGTIGKFRWKGPKGDYNPLKIKI